MKDTDNLSVDRRLTAVITGIDKRLAVMEAIHAHVRDDVVVIRDKVEMLNDWHSKVNGALAVLLFLGGAILSKLLDMW